MGTPLLQVENLKTYIYTRRGVVKAIDGASFTVDRGETLGIVGESGSGKSTAMLSILRLLPRHSGRIVGGRIMFEGEDIVTKSEREMRRIRGGKIATILQDPMSSLDPVFTVGSQVAEAVKLHQPSMSGKAVWQRVVEALGLVRISDPAARASQYPHQLSGGMRQRVSGAVAVSCAPSLLIADEPTTALDVTVQAQYLAMLKQLQKELNLAMIFITHDLGVVANVCDRVAVMYGGRIVETGSVRTLFQKPCHPYTKSLLACIPSMKGKIDRLETIKGSPPSPLNLPPGCAFEPRCSYAIDRCRKEYPPAMEVDEGHSSNCWLAHDLHRSYAAKGTTALSQAVS